MHWFFALPFMISIYYLLKQMEKIASWSIKVLHPRPPSFRGTCRENRKNFPGIQDALSGTYLNSNQQHSWRGQEGNGRFGRLWCFRIMGCFEFLVFSVHAEGNTTVHITKPSLPLLFPHSHDKAPAEAARTFAKHILFLCSCSVLALEVTKSLLAYFFWVRKIIKRKHGESLSPFCRSSPWNPEASTQQVTKEGQSADINLLSCTGGERF